MTAVLVGLIFIGFTVFSVLPQDWALQWGPSVLDFLKGGLPVFSLLIGLVAVLIGIADIRDRLEEKREANGKDPKQSKDSVSVDEVDK